MRSRTTARGSPRQTGISSKLIREWVDNVDLMRVPGVGPQYSDLLEAAGVGSPAELAQRNPANLAITVQEVVAARPGIVRRIPSEAEIAAWIEEAGKLDEGRRALIAGRRTAHADHAVRRALPKPSNGARPTQGRSPACDHRSSGHDRWHADFSSTPLGRS